MKSIEFSASNRGISVTVHAWVDTPPTFKGCVIPSEIAVRSPTCYLQWEEWEHPAEGDCIRRESTIFFDREGLVALQKRVTEMGVEFDAAFPPAEG